MVEFVINEDLKSNPRADYLEMPVFGKAELSIIRVGVFIKEPLHITKTDDVAPLHPGGKPQMVRVVRMLPGDILYIKYPDKDGEAIIAMRNPPPIRCKKCNGEGCDICLDGYED